MIFFGVLNVAFFYLIAFMFHVEWPVYTFFALSAAFVMYCHSKKHFKTAQMTFLFLYLITVLLWTKGGISLMPQFVFLLGAASLTFVLSDISFKIFFGILSWFFVGVTIFLLMYERFGSIPLAVVIGLVVIPIGLRDLKYVKNKDRSF